jgi:starch-binding outer membrane protein, SusD/RagB family
MKKKMLYHIVCLLALAAFLPACKKEIGSLNGSTIEELSANATKFQMSNVVTGIEAGMRNNIDFYLDVTGLIGREMYRFAGSEPRYTSEVLGSSSATLNNNTFYLTNPWNARYRVVKNCNILIAAATNSTVITTEERKGFLGFAKTIKAYQLLLNLNLTQSNGVRLQVEDPDNLGPIVGYDESLTAIAALLDEAKADFTGANIVFTLTAGFTGFKNAAGLLQFNRALAARVAVYRGLWPAALTALNESFFDLNGDLNKGVYHVFSSGPNDQLNPTFVGQNQTGEIRLAHPSYATDITPGDDRIGKATLRTSAASSDNLTSDRDVWVYTSSTAPMPIIRNEELILIYAEAKIQSNAFPDAIVALNRIRTAHNLPVYAGGISQAALRTEMLNQRRYSLFFEGHRWVDMRRYGRLNELPLDRAGDDVWEKFPLPLTES